MDSTDSPEVGGARGAHSPSHRENQNLNAALLPEEPAASNRKLIKTERGFDLFEVMERRRRFHYEITCGEQRWVFPLLWSAFLRFDRLTKKGARHE